VAAPVVDPAPPELPDAAREAAGEIFVLDLRLGGTPTGARGVGVLKRQWIAKELGPRAHAVAAAEPGRVRSAGDPHPGLSL
jgi:hypothetical protein